MPTASIVFSFPFLFMILILILSPRSVLYAFSRSLGFSGVWVGFGKSPVFLADIHRHLFFMDGRVGDRGGALERLSDQVQMVDLI